MASSIFVNLPVVVVNVAVDVSLARGIMTVRCWEVMGTLVAVVVSTVGGGLTNLHTEETKLALVT